MAWYNWSRTAASNANADATINMAEGMAPSQVNDGIRALMARSAEYRDDISGAIVTTGTSTAYVVASYSVFSSLSVMNGQMIAFTPHATNGDTVTLNVDGLGAKPLRPAPSTELVAGTLVQGTPYVAVYNNSDAAFYLQSYFSSPYNVPFLGGLDYWDTVTPNSSFIFPAGQAISRTVYSRAFARWGTQFGAGDGSTTFNVPDKRGRVSAMIEATSTRLTNLSSGNSTVLGGTGGNDKQTIGNGNLPPNIPWGGGWAFTPSTPGTFKIGTTTGTLTSGGAVTNVPIVATDFIAGGSIAASGFAVNPSGANTPLPTVQPTITCNYIIRII